MLLALWLALGWLPVPAHAAEMEMDQPVSVNFMLTTDSSSVWDTYYVDDCDSFCDWYEELPMPELEGYFFVGWSVSKDEWIPFDPEEPIFYSPYGVYLYGFWDQDTACTATFLVDGEVYREITTPDGYVQMPEIPGKPGQIPKGWLTEDGEIFDGYLEEDLCLFAGWYDFTVTYDPNGSLGDAGFEMEIYGADDGDQTPECMADLKLEESIFDGWEPTVEPFVSESVTYTARWRERPRKTFSLTYDPNCEQDPTLSGLPNENPQVVTTFDLETEYLEFFAVPVLERAGFRFLGWNTKPDGTGEMTAPGASYMVDGDGYLYGIWEQITCYVAFEGENTVPCLWGTEIGEEKFPLLELDAQNCAQRDEGYFRFAGWYTGPNGTGKAFSPGTQINTDMTIYPHWIQQIRTTFRIEHGVWKETGSKVCTVTQDRATLLKDQLPTPVPEEGFLASGSWNTPLAQAALEDAVYVFTCEARPVFTVAFDGQEPIRCPMGERIAENQFPTGEEMGLDENGRLERDGYIYRLGGWYTGPGGTGKEFTSQTVIQENWTLYPYWIRQIEITFQIENGIWAETGKDSDTVMLDKGAPLKDRIPTPVPDESCLASGKWDRDPALTNAYEPAVYVFTCDPCPEYTVTFEGFDPITCLAGEKIREAQIPGAEQLGLDAQGCLEREDGRYRFGGWFTGKDGTGTAFTADTEIKGSLTVYPCWIRQVTITFQIENGTWKESGTTLYSIVLDKGASLTDWIPTAIPEEKYLESGKWNMSPATASAFTETTFVYTCDARMKFTLTLKDGETEEPVEVLEGRPIGRLPEPEKPGWIFLGWFTEERQITESFLLEGNLVLEARWRKYTSVTFDANGGENPPQSLSGQESYVIPVRTPTRLGYLFQGWSLEKNAETGEYQPDDTYTPTGEEILYAVWKPEEYQITYNDGVKTSIIFYDIVFTAAYGEETPQPESKPIRNGYTFRGWNPAVSETVTGTALYEAQWAKTTTTNPKTGDGSDIRMWTWILALSGGSLILLADRKRRSRI